MNALRGIPGAIVRMIDHGNVPIWQMLSSVPKVPETDKDALKVIANVRSDCEKRRMGEQFRSWLQAERHSGQTNKHIANTLWSAARDIADIRQESLAHRCLKQLDEWLKLHACTELHVELAATLAQARGRVAAALDLARSHHQEHVFQLFLDTARKQGKPDIILASELSAEGVPPWYPTTPRSTPPVTDKEIRATIEEARAASRYRGLATEFANWMQTQTAGKQSHAQIAHTLWKAAHVIDRAMTESAANGTGERLQQWLVSEAHLKPEVTIASALTDAARKLREARLVAREEGREDAYLAFIRSARAEGKPDVVIVSEVSQRGTPVWMPEWTPPVQKVAMPHGEQEVLAFMDKAESDCERRWLGSRFRRWVRLQRMNDRSDVQIAQALWRAPEIIERFRQESMADSSVRELDRWLVSHARTTIDVELAEDLVAAKEQLDNALNLAREAGREDAFTDFIRAARRDHKPDVLILEEWEVSQSPTARNLRPADPYKDMHRHAFAPAPKTTAKHDRRDAYALPAQWTLPARPLRTAPTTHKEVDETIQAAVDVHEARWLGNAFTQWLSDERQENKTELQIANSLWEAAEIIHATRDECEAQGKLAYLDEWLATAGATMTDVELASNLKDVAAKLRDAETTARMHGGGDEYQRFVGNARREGKPDVVIFKEWSDALA